jgi:transposase-like protein
VRDALVDVRCGRAIDYQAEQFGPTVVTARVHNSLASIDLSKVKICDHFTFTSCEGLTDNLALWIDNGGEAATRNRPDSTTRILHDQTYVKVAGEWCYLYRAIDRDGNLVDVFLSETRDMAAAKAFLRSARSVTLVEPEQVTTDGHTSYPKAIAEELGTDVDHRTSQYKNNVIEQNHRGIKGRYRPMRGFKNFDAAHRFCRAFDEVRNFLRPTNYINQNVSLARRRALHVERVAALRDLISAA